ncbi:hypothetical protein, partial [Streptomyces bambusae]
TRPRTTPRARTDRYPHTSAAPPGRRRSARGSAGRTPRSQLGALVTNEVGEEERIGGGADAARAVGVPVVKTRIGLYAGVALCA